MRQNKAYCEFRKRHPRRQDLLEFLYSIKSVREILGIEIARAPVAGWEFGVLRHLPAQTAFIERDSDDDSDVQLLASWKQLILRRLIKDAIDDLHRIDQTCADGL